MSYKLEEIEGIGPVKKAALHKAGLTTTQCLLDHCHNPAGRKETAAASGLTEQELLKFTNMADLMRIKGVGEEFSELLEAAGVDTVKELKHRVPANLTKALADAQAKRNMVRRLPSETEVAGWIEQAKALPPILTY